MFRIVIHRRAQLDVDRSLAWIHRRSPQGASSWIDAYDAAVARLQSDPTAHPRLSGARPLPIDVRHLTFQSPHGLKYVILFVVDGSAEEVHILRVRGPGQPPVHRRDLK